MTQSLELSRRERQIMDIIYARGQATATDVLAGMADAPTRSAVRTFLRILEDKRHLRHHKEGREFVYVPTRRRQRVGLSALRGVLSTFFSGSLKQAVAAHLSESGAAVSEDELEHLSKLIDEARKRGG